MTHPPYELNTYSTEINHFGFALIANVVSDQEIEAVLTE